MSPRPGGEVVVSGFDRYLLFSLTLRISIWAVLN